MSSSTQDFVCNFITEKLKSRGLTTHFAWNWANQGRCYVRRGQKTVANLQLDFQGDHLSVALSLGRDKAEYFGHHDKIWYIDYCNIKQIEEITSRLSLLL